MHSIYCLFFKIDIHVNFILKITYSAGLKVSLPPLLLRPPICGHLGEYLEQPYFN